jgi:EAL domain-containing protein (putative c-di-GMP-specific phosphodiesterase class I)
MSLALSPRPDRTRILVVEDDVALARALVRSLSREGFAVSVAHDGIVAGETLMSERFDVVVSDVNLPGASGVDLLRLVRVHDLDVPILLVTGTPDAEKAQRAVELGALLYLTKPVATDVLSASLHRAARLGRLARAKREAQSLAKVRGIPAGDRTGLIVAFERALEGLRLELSPVVDARSLRTRAMVSSFVSSEPLLPTRARVRDAAERLGAVQHLEARQRTLLARELAEGGKAARAELVFLEVALSELETTPSSIAGPELAPFASRVVLEISEQAELGSVHGVARGVRALRDAAFRFSVCDVGSGEAGLVRFATLEPDYVHLDALLLRDADASFARRRVLGELSDACHALGAQIIADGVTTRAELSCARAFGCDLLRGEMFGRSATPA